MNALLKNLARYIGRPHFDSGERKNPSAFIEILDMKKHYAGDDGMVADISAVSGLISAWRSLPIEERRGNEHSFITNVIETINWNEIVGFDIDFFKKFTPRHCPICKSTDYRCIYNIYNHLIVRCNDCHFIYSRYVMCKDELLRYYDHLYLSQAKESNYERVGVPVDAVNALQEGDARFFINAAQSMRFFVDESVKYLHTPEGKTFLDLCSGWGASALYAKQLGMHVTALEINSRNCSIGRLLGIAMENNDLLDADIPDNTYDVVYCRHGLEHIYDPVKFTQKIFNICSPEGYVYIVVPNWDSFWHEREKINWPWLDPVGHVSYFTRKSLSSLMENSGFAVIECGSMMFSENDETSNSLKEAFKNADFKRERERERERACVWMQVLR